MEGESARMGRRPRSKDQRELALTLPTAPYWAKNMPSDDSTTLAGTAAKAQVSTVTPGVINMWWNSISQFETCTFVVSGSPESYEPSLTVPYSLAAKWDGGSQVSGQLRAD